MDFKDSLANFVSKLGTSGSKDPYSYFKDIVVTEQELLAAYKFGGLAGKIVDAPADDMARKWRKVNAPDYDFGTFYELEESLDVKAAFVAAEKWAALFGGSAIVIDFGTEDDAEPLDVGTVSAAKPVSGLRVLTRYEFANADIDKRTGRLTTYKELATGTVYDPSRVLLFDGVRLPVKEMVNNGGWGASRVTRCYGSLVAEASVAAGVRELVHEAHADVVGVTNLAQHLDGGTRQQAFMERYALAKFMKSLVNVTLYDKENEEWGERGTSQALTALAPLLEKLANRLAGEADVPLTRLYGALASGLNTSAGTNQKDYYDMLAARQEANWSAPLKAIDELLFASLGVAVPPEYYSEWLPLAELTEQEQAATDKTRAETAEINIRNGVAVPAQAAEQIAVQGPYDYPKELLDYMRERDGLTTPPQAEQEAAAVTGAEVAGAAGAVGEVQKQALNGAQISALVEIATKVKAGEIDQESGVAIVLAAVPAMSEQEARRVVGEFDEAKAERDRQAEEQRMEALQQTRQQPPGNNGVQPDEI